MRTAIKNDLKRLREEMQQEKGQTCVSIIVSTDGFPRNRRRNETRVQKMIESAKEQLKAKVDPEQIDIFYKGIDHLRNQVDFTYVPKGYGLFVSPNIHVLLPFPFPVQEKVVVGESFLLRYLLLKESYVIPYYVLLLTKEKAKLFRAEADRLEEVIDSNFPFLYVEDFEYSLPSSGSSFMGYSQVKDFEKDKSIGKEARFKTFLKDLDKVLDAYLAEEDLLIVCGVKKEEAYFINLTTHSEHLAGILTGNYDYKNAAELAELVWPYITSYIDQKKKDEIDIFEERMGEGLGEFGLQDVWRAVKEGRGVQLLIEKDFSARGYLVNDDYRLLLSPTRSSSYKVLTDAVESLIELVLEKGEQIVIVENGVLQNYDRVGLITRY